MSRPCATVAAVVGLSLLAGCSQGGARHLPLGDAAFPAVVPEAQRDDEARIRPGDRLFITVLGEPELTSDQYRVDGAGNLQLPLVGSVKARGLTLSDLSEGIRQQLGRGFIRDPQVSISIIERKRAVFTVEGEVREPGVFEAAPNTTLLSAVAQAKSPNRVAHLNEIVVFRDFNGERRGARFDLKAIRNGTAPDPQIVAGDTIVVGFSQIKGAWRDLLEAAPLFNFFYLLK